MPARKTKAKTPVTEGAARGGGKPRLFAGPIVAIGASTDGLRSIGAVLRGLPKGFRAAVCVVIHLDPKHVSRVASVLQGTSPLPVLEASEGLPLRPGHVYVAVRDRHMEIRGGRIHLSRAKRVNYVRPAADRLFASVAEEARGRAIAVVLSGLGRDGSEGVVRVKEGGGVAIAEHRSSAGSRGMPDAAIATHLVDAVLPAAEIGPAVTRIVAGEPFEGGRAEWSELLALLRQRFRTDFSGYKASTLRRRLQGRILATGARSIVNYLSLVSKDDAELERLHSALLLKVSGFMRDAAAWRHLSKEVVPALVKAAKAGEDVRIWSAGCATGEEPYSIAILLFEKLPEASWDRVRVFATDADEEALAKARAGRYTTAQLRPLTARQRRRFFVAEGGLWRVRSDVQSRVIFGSHDLTRDPPMANLDLLICRNVLIYFSDEQKEAVLPRFVYAVKPGRYAFLGKSEGFLSATDAFKPVVAASRIYVRTPVRFMLGPMPAPVPYPPTGTPRLDLRHEMATSARGLVAQTAFQSLLVHSAPVVVVAVDARRRITLWNKAAELLFARASEKAIGSPLLDAMEGVSADRIGKLVRDCAEAAKATEDRDVALEGEGPTKYLDFWCAPMSEKGVRPTGVLIVATDATGRVRAEHRQADLLRDLRKALEEASEANQRLVTGNEELETLNEELQSTTEEHQTLNEELQSRNEELETVNEELQSTNEELSTLNEELRARTEEVDRTNAFLRAVFASSAEPVVVADPRGTVLAIGRSASRMFRLSEAQAVGEDLFSLVPALEQRAVRAAVRRALQGRLTTVVENLELVASGDRLKASVSPVVDREDRVAGFVLVLASELKMAAPTAESVGVIFRVISRPSATPMVLCTGDGRIVAANPAADAYFGVGTRGLRLAGTRLSRALAKDTARALSKAGAKRPLRAGTFRRVALATAFGQRRSDVGVHPVPGTGGALAVVSFQPLSEP